MESPPRRPQMTSSRRRTSLETTTSGKVENEQIRIISVWTLHLSVAGSIRYINGALRGLTSEVVSRPVEAPKHVYHQRDIALAMVIFP